MTREKDKLKIQPLLEKCSLYRNLWNMTRHLNIQPPTQTEMKCKECFLRKHPPIITLTAAAFINIEATSSSLNCWDNAFFLSKENHSCKVSPPFFFLLCSEQKNKLGPNPSVSFEWEREKCTEESGLMHTLWLASSVHFMRREKGRYVFGLFHKTLGWPC